MKVESKFDIGSTVFIMDKNKILQTKVAEISFGAAKINLFSEETPELSEHTYKFLKEKVTASDYLITRATGVFNIPIERKESEVFSTREELIKSL